MPKFSKTSKNKLNSCDKELQEVFNTQVNRESFRIILPIYEK